MDLYRKIKGLKRLTRDRDVRIKLGLFLLALDLKNVSEACARWGFSRRFYYKWWGRLKKSGFKLSSLQEKSRRPKKSPRRTPSDIEAKIYRLKRRKVGSRMIEAMLRRSNCGRSRAVICHIMNGRKKIKKSRRARLKAHQKRYELPIPGQRMQMDVKYVPYPIEGKKAYSYVIIDECTRWRYASTFDSLDEGTTLRFLDQVMAICPFPIHCIQTDNGQEFTYRLNPVAKHLEHRVTSWCHQHGIRHRLIPPGVKELNGKVERSHRVDEQWFYWRADSHSLDAFNRFQKDWMAYYNGQRLHGGIEYMTPLEKLEERAKALKTESLPPELEPLRLKFLLSRPIPMRPGEKQDRQILHLETELKRLLKEIA
jgi:transposase InsO family protein